MRSLLLSLLLALTAWPAVACPFITENLDMLEFIDDGEQTVLWRHVRTGRLDVCSWARTDEGTGSVILCDGGVREFFANTPGGIEMNGEVWRNHCIGSMNWSEAYVPPHGNGVGWAGRYPLKPDADYDGPRVLRWEELRNAELFDHVRGVEFSDILYVFELVTLEQDGEVWQELDLTVDIGGDGYRLLHERYDGAPFSKLVTELDILRAREAKGGASVEIDWFSLAKAYVDESYENEDAWEGVLAGEGPIPWSQLGPRMEHYAALEEICNGGWEGTDSSYRDGLCRQLPAIEAEIEVYGHCRTEPGHPMPWEWC